LTQSCIFLHHGKVIEQGSTEKVINEYLSHGLSIDHIYVDKYSDCEPKVTQVKITTSEPGNTHIHSEAFDVEFEIYTPRPLKGGNLTFHIINMYDQSIAHFWLFDSKEELFNKKGFIKLRCRIPKFRLFMGKYTITLYFTENLGTTQLQEIKNICPFEIVMFNHKREYEWQEHSCTYIDEFVWENL
jgi:lipopolysaccharide transport system ATP-binding protein